LRKTVGLLLAAAVLVGVAGTAKADAPELPPRLQQILGMVAAKHFAGGASGLGKLRYHSGPVMHTNQTYAIYWVPAGYSVSSDYRSLIDRFLGDVAADSGKTSNVYSSDTQYTDSGGKAAYSSTFGGSVIDTNPYPASGCTDKVTQTTVCLSDAQIQAEVKRVAAAQGWGNGPTKLFFMFTAKNVGSCADASSCAFSQYCAYHSWIGSGSTETLYANQPYTDTVPSACDAAPHPNGSEADPTINVVSHEHNEAVTDPNGNAWYDLLGYENGDKCAWNFGTSIGSTSSGAYNQLINGHPYMLQQEYSNARSGCVLTGT
jgi:hypothetical protein